MSLLRLTALVITLALAATACEENLFTTDPPPGVVDEGDPTPDGSVVASCGLDTFAGDLAFAEAVCDYQAALIRALGAGVTVDGALTDAVSNALLLWVTDPGQAYQIVVDAIAQIDALIAAVPDITTSTVADLTDDLFACVGTASDLLQVAFEHVDVGGAVIPELEDWQAAFDEAAVLAGQGDVAGATALVCSLIVEMDAVLYQT